MKRSRPILERRRCPWAKTEQYIEYHDKEWGVPVHDFIDLKDFPKFWRRKKITVEVEAKAKEVAVEKLLRDLETEGSWLVYILRCADDSLYTGITNDLPRRLKQHNAGTASRFTRSRLPAVLVYQEAQASRSHALKRELAIKALSRQAKESLILGAGLKGQNYLRLKTVLTFHAPIKALLPRLASARRRKLDN